MDKKIPTRGPLVPVGNEACQVCRWNGELEGRDFPVPLNTNDRLFFSHTINFYINLAKYCIIFVGEVIELKFTKTCSAKKGQLLLAKYITKNSH